MAMARMRRACLASAVRAASARNCEILRSWRVISIADMMPAPRIIDGLHRVTFADGWESHRSQVLRRLVSYPPSTPTQDPSGAGGVPSLFGHALEGEMRSSLDFVLRACLERFYRTS